MAGAETLRVCCRFEVAESAFSPAIFQDVLVFRPDGGPLLLNPNRWDLDWSLNTGHSRNEYKLVNAPLLKNPPIKIIATIKHLQVPHNVRPDQFVYCIGRYCQSAVRVATGQTARLAKRPDTVG